MQYVPANEVQVGDTIWKEQDMVVTRVRVLSVSTAIYAQRVGKVGPEYGGSEWLLENWYQVPVTRELPLSVTHPCNDPKCDTGDIATHQWHMTVDDAKRRLAVEQASCASPEDIAYWKYVILDLGGEG